MGPKTFRQPQHRVTFLAASVVVERLPGPIGGGGQRRVRGHLVQVRLDLATQLSRVDDRPPHRSRRCREEPCERFGSVGDREVVKGQHLDDEGLHNVPVVGVPPLEHTDELGELGRCCVSSRHLVLEHLRIRGNPHAVLALWDPEATLSSYQSGGDVNGESVGILGIIEEALHRVILQPRQPHRLVLPGVRAKQVGCERCGTS